MIQRLKTREVEIGEIAIGGENPIAVQSMIVEDTSDIEGCVRSILKLYGEGCELIRVTTPTLKDVHCLGEIRARLADAGHPKIPLVADIHHNGWRIAIEVSRFVDKIRINPGLFVFSRKNTGEDYTDEEIRTEREKIRQQMRAVINACQQHKTAMRIGVNHGSLSERMLFMHGNTPEGMVESAIEFIEICESEAYYDLVVSLKASRVPVMIEANRILAKKFRARGQGYPIHLGVTEAGDGTYARIKSTAGIATLLAEGIGDTIRVSLAEDPIEEIPVCYDILQALGLRKTKVEFIACPSCGRTKFNLTEVVPKVRKATEHLAGLHIAVMGCIVNGPGEMADADYGYVGQGIGKVSLYRGREVVRRGIPEEQGILQLINLIKADGKWVEPQST
ncbi:MAG: 4-hydroxy-3-methylbut-2-en-1-yl diphosphate synthase [Acidobacteria bacterium]|nr:MAG: 4-hydroxy-3-methylbut-2-en-1-yl diphosphate synthase [Acidobacteriota bacterium]PIE89710.1 MAG: 4-hydroxy-3-methylbut-2-en-1-yl diphosphate synthase [Acidobacteriota bacterium]